MVSAAIGLFFLAVVLLGFSAAIRGDGLERNRTVGIRTRATMASDEAWARGHRAAARWVLATGVLALVLGVIALMIRSIADERPAGLAIFVSVAYGAVVILCAVIARVAHVAARDADDE
ncbi:MAG: SdpI family protein [Austwickia sp.]|jgi:uncharacterized membrane protein|nr:MAG: SdpI family protein [Austwickia sp.]